MQPLIVLLCIVLCSAALFGNGAPQPPSPPMPPTPTPAPAPPEAPDEEKTLVWVTPSGKKYHKASCRYAKSGSSVTLKEARRRGLTACKSCGGC
jgi:hypothetical protein